MGRMWNPCGLVTTTVALWGLPLMASGSTRGGGGRGPPPGSGRGPRLAGRVVGAFQQRPHLLAGLGLAEGLDEAVVAEAAGDVLQGPEVVAGAILGRDQQDEDVDRLAVEAVELDPGGGEGNG